MDDDLDSPSGSPTGENWHDQETPEYAEKAYWEGRYGSSESYEIYDWYRDYDSCFELKSLLNKWISKKSKVLIVGCGNSRLTEQMYADGYKEIWSIDFSTKAIEIMKRRATLHYPGLENRYLLQDARNMTFEKQSFDAIIDKGTFDAMMCGRNNLSNCSKLCSESSRLLRPGGVFILISYGNPDTRLDTLNKSKFRWRIEYGTLKKENDDNIHHVYVMIKK